MVRTYALGANIDTETLNDGIRGSQGDGVVTGCAVTAQGVPDMTVAVAAGTVICGNKIANVTAANVTITAAHASLDRYDVVVSSDAGALSAVAGTPAASPTAQIPHSSATQVALAIVYVPAAASTIQTAQITDARIMVRARYGDLIYNDETWTDYTAAGSSAYTIKTITIPAGVLRREDEITGEFWLVQDQANNATFALDFAAGTLAVGRNIDYRQRIYFKMFSHTSASGVTSVKSMAYCETSQVASSVAGETSITYSGTEVQMQNTFDILIKLTMTSGKKCSVTNIKVWKTGLL